jgi:hypothetical protein
MVAYFGAVALVSTGHDRVLDSGSRHFVARAVPPLGNAAALEA